MGEYIDDALSPLRHLVGDVADSLDNYAMAMSGGGAKGVGNAKNTKIVGDGQLKKADMPGGGAKKVIDLDQKPNVTNEKLKNIVNDLYKGQGGSNTIGNGTTMDAVRNEILTRNPTNGKYHTQKLNDYLNALQRRLRAGDLNEYDTAVTKSLIEDIKNALGGKK